MVATPKRLGPDLCGGVAVLPICDGKVGLLHVWRHPLQQWGIEVVKGFLDGPESSREAAMRELAEEAGLECRPSDLIYLGPAAPESGTIEAVSHGYLARDCRRLAAPPQSDDAGPGQLVWYDPGFAADMALGRTGSTPQLLDAITLVCLLRAVDYQARPAI